MGKTAFRTVIGVRFVLFHLYSNEADFAQLRQELLSEPEDVHDDGLRNVVCVVPRHNLAHTQLTGQIDSGTFLNYVMLFKNQVGEPNN
jgi:hypothetical protein